MKRTSAVEKSYYLGSLSHSLKRLPQWYQILALGGVAIAVYLRHTAVVQWLVIYLHSSLGTESVWYPDYKVLLDNMTFNERIGFTLYGVTLAATVTVLYRLFCRSTVNSGWAGGQLFADRRKPTLLVYFMMCVVEGVRLRLLIARVLSDENSVAYTALHSLKSPLHGSFAHHVAGMNTHFVIQVEIFRALVSSFARHQVPALVIACAYRMLRDVPRHRHAALRWYMNTVACIAIAVELAKLYLFHRWNGATSWVTMLWTLTFMGVVNFLYGPRKRAGMVETVSTLDAAKETLRGTVTCAAMWCIASLAVLTVVVGVHVVELVCIWVVIFMLIVWLPAIIDACATDYIAMLTIIACELAHEMQYVNGRGAIRLGLMVSLWWLNLCLGYNVVVNLCRSRYAGMATLLCVLLWAVSPAEPGDHVAAHATRALFDNMNMSRGLSLPTNRTGLVAGATRTSVAANATTVEAGVIDIATVLARRLQLLRDIAEFRPLRPSTAWLAAQSHGCGHEAYELVLRAGLLLVACLVSINVCIGRWQSAETKARLRRNAIALINYTVFVRKLVRMSVHLFCIACFLVSWFVFQRFVLPRIASLLPSPVSKGLSVVVACTVLGGVSDMKEYIYECVARALGLINPPSRLDSGEDSAASNEADNSDEGEDDDDDLEAFSK